MRILMNSDGSIILDVPDVKNVKKAAAKHFDELQTVKKKRNIGPPRVCEICNNLFKSKAGLSIHKHYAHKES